MIKSSVRQINLNQTKSTHKNETNVLSPKPGDHIKVKPGKEIIVSHHNLVT